ncbi:MAG: ABC transporter ATP-binding protein [Candidatus Coatesbacteria bacterium]|nr:ABC transporter ATP-binding protein [Candidatus Coatesbacteria bacterium]
MLEARNLKKSFFSKDGKSRRRRLLAVDGVSFSVQEGETFAVVGESGSGKTTLAMLMTRLLRPDAGSVHFEGEDVLSLDGKELLSFRRAVQMVFQDPFASLDPRMRVGQIVGEGMRIHRLCSRGEQRGRVGELLELVGLPSDAMRRFPHEFSGGQRQRIGIARALAVEPRMIVADEPVSALDVSVQAKILNLLIELKAKRRLTYMIIAHNMRLVARIADTIAVMYQGRLLEVAPANELFVRPAHPYTKLLLASIPALEKASKQPAVVPWSEPASDIRGCRFRQRCAEALPLCQETEPELASISRGRLVACHFVQG